MKLIDKSSLVAEIERRKNICQRVAKANKNENNELAHLYYKGKTEAYSEMLEFLDTLEMKEVDNVWHDASEIPKGAGDKEILVQFSDFHTSVLEIDDWEYLNHQTKWAYLKDLI